MDRSLPDVRLFSPARLAQGQADRSWSPYAPAGVERLRDPGQPESWNGVRPWSPNAPAGVEKMKEPRPASPVRFPNSQLQDAECTNSSQPRELPAALPTPLMHMDKKTMMQELNSVMERLQNMKDLAQEKIQKLQAQQELLEPCWRQDSFEKKFKAPAVHDDVQLSMEKQLNKLGTTQDVLSTAGYGTPGYLESPLECSSRRVGFSEFGQPGHLARQQMARQEIDLNSMCFEGQDTAAYRQCSEDILPGTPTHMRVFETQESLPNRSDPSEDCDLDSTSTFKLQASAEDLTSVESGFGSLPAAAPDVTFPMLGRSQSCRAGLLEDQAEVAAARSPFSASHGYWHLERNQATPDFGHVMRRSQSCKEGLLEFAAELPTVRSESSARNSPNSCSQEERAPHLHSYARSDSSALNSCWQDERPPHMYGYARSDSSLLSAALDTCVQEERSLRAQGSSPEFVAWNSSMQEATDETADMEGNSSLISQADVDADKRVRTLRKLANDEEALARKERRLSMISAERRAANELKAQTLARHREWFAKTQEEKRQKLERANDIREDLIQEHGASRMGSARSASARRRAGLQDAARATREMEQALRERVQVKMTDEDTALQRKAEHLKSISDARRADNLEKQQRVATHKQLSQELTEVRKSLMIETEEDRRAWIEQQRNAQQQKLAEVGAKLSDSISRAAEDRKTMREIAQGRFNHKQVGHDAKQVRKARQIEDRRRHLQEQNKLKQQRLQRTRSYEELVMKSLRSMGASF